MYIYIITFLITILLIWLAENKAKSKTIKTIVLILAIMPMFFISAIRYDVGTDYDKRYMADYYTLAEGKNVGNLEIGFKVIDYICLFFTQEPYLLFVVTSLIILAIIFEVIYKKSSNKILSITIFFLCGYFFGTLNLIRHYIAMALVLLGYQFLMDKNQKKAYIGFVICAILAFFMHSSSIVCFIMLFLTQKNICNIKIVLPLSILILILNQNIMTILTPIIKNTRFKVYLTGTYAQSELSVLQIVENLLVYVWMSIIYYFQKKKNMEIKKEEITLLNIQGISFLLTVAGVIHSQFMRIAIYFGIFQILSIPYFFNMMNFDDISKKISDKFKKTIKANILKNIIYIAIVVIFICMFTYTNILNNDNEVIPYKTIFSQLQSDK